MNTNPYVRVKVAFGGFRVGHTFRPNGLYRDRLVACGLVEIIKPDDVAEAAKQTVKAEVNLPRRSRAQRKAQTA